VLTSDDWTAIQRDPLHRSRPSILEVNKAISCGLYASAAEAIVHSACALVAELVLFYPGCDIYLLGRDMEYFYDVMYLLWAAQEIPVAPRLLEVTRDSSLDPRLADYCQQQGLGLCRRAVVVDSGVHGNVITAIRRVFPETTVNGILLYSENPVYPSSEASLLRLGAPLSLSRFERRRTLEDRIERLPHFERKVIGYEARSGRIVPRRQSSASTEWRKRALCFMTELRRELCSYVVSGGWKAELRAFSNLVEAVDASTGRTRRAVVPLRELESRRAQSDPVGADPRAEVAYALADLGREAAERLKDPLLTIELDPSGASRRVIAAAEELTARLGEPRVVVAYPTGPTARQKISLGRDLNPQQVVAAVWAHLDKDVEEISTDLIRARLDAVLRLPHGSGFIKDVLDAAARRALNRAIRAEAVGALWELLTGRR
jgi:hypothetical protein